MFKEIMQNVVDFLSVSTMYYLDTYENLSMKKYLTLGYDIPVDSIVKMHRFTISDKLPDVFLIDVDYDASFRVCDYAIIDGEVVKVITFNKQLLYKDEGNTIAMVLTLFGDVCNTIVEYYRPMINAGITSTVSFTNLLMYAPMVLSVAYLNEISPWIKDEDITLIVRYMYKNATEATIASARKLVTDFTIESLFDKDVWYGVTNTEYPFIRCNEVDPENDGNDSEEEWSEGVDENTEDEDNETV